MVITAAATVVQIRIIQRDPISRSVMNVLLTVGVGGRVFKEGRLLQSLAAALLMTAGAVVVVLTAGRR